MRFWTEALEKGIEARRWLPWGMMALGVLGVYIVGFEQGHLLRVFLGDVALRYNWLHELFHDARHSAGFPCH